MMHRPFCLLTSLSLFVVSYGEAQEATDLRIHGDFRLRYEYTSQANGTPSLGREVLRFRIGATRTVREGLVVRARLATGSPGDPNSTDVTVGQFVDDLTMSLDLVSVELTRPRWALFGGKFVNPLLSTELLWDGDVNPQGLGGRLKLGNGSLTGTLTGLYFVLDAQPGDSSSDMAGAQLAVTGTPRAGWQVTAAAGYYDYRIRSLSATDAGDIRGNRLAPGGDLYLSDFDLLNLLLAAEYTGLGERLPLRVVGDLVRNFGADQLHTAWSADLYLGRTQRPGDTRWRYGFALVETDAVLAAFAHDNTTMGTNSETHTFSVDAVPIADLMLTATWYRYRPHQPPPGLPREFQDRIRLNAMVMF